MDQHRLPDGREVYLKRLAIAGTYAGMMEGNPETASPYILESLSERATRMLSPAKPLAIVPPLRMPLPNWICVAELESQRGARQNDPDYNSRLYVCWFVRNTARSIDTLVKAVLPLLDWDRQAEDFDIMDF